MNGSCATACSEMRFSVTIGEVMARMLAATQCPGVSA